MECSAAHALNYIMGRVEEEVDIRSLVQQMPLFLQGEVGKLIQENVGTLARPAELRLGLEEDTLQNVPKLEKDTLMPKDLSEEKASPKSPDCLSPRSSASLRKSLKLAKKDSKGLTSKLKSISMH